MRLCTFEVSTHLGRHNRVGAFRDGRISIQDEASQTIPLLLDVHTGDRVLDVCAAPGGKTSILARAAGSGYVVATTVLTITGGGGTGATATLSTLSGSGLGNIQITNTGQGYTSPPRVTASNIGAGVGINATPTAVLYPTTVVPINGVALFGGLSINAAGSGYVIQAQSGSTTALSGSLTVTPAAAAQLDRR